MGPYFCRHVHVARVCGKCFHIWILLTLSWILLTLSWILLTLSWILLTLSWILRRSKSMMDEGESHLKDIETILSVSQAYFSNKTPFSLHVHALGIYTNAIMNDGRSVLCLAAPTST